MKIIVSGCLLGNNCKYNGGNNYNENVVKFLENKDYIVICPEEMGKLTIPRVPSEIQYSKTADEVLKNEAKVLSKNGDDVTKYFIDGANKALEIAKRNNCKLAILKDGSPSCGSNYIYDGNFEGKKIYGKGVCARLLENNGIEVISEYDVL
ncbi:DUF523 domain-containing protein [Peptostreptococcus porci]|uniref:DUF523 domain-containing protein n=1 Tax=Peptostreptococcus porci TaxID=2652282 RepID=UPI0023F5634A|nr:DUF523 domain-containing protein [Peptostreptococcus porci]MDD7182693.1 DUF523 domain-containing protein [Peptostreptococcus porci]MDY5964576.1 DUF523 domain-containing protein [Peptostreptococcus porci]